MNRRAALKAVGAVAGTLYGTTRGVTAQRQMMLVLDDLQVITVRYRGREVSVSPSEIVDALQGKNRPQGDS
jgi:hypothetical protein